MSGGMGLHLYIEQVDQLRGYGVVYLWHEYIWIHVCMIWVDVKNDFLIVNYEHDVFSLSMIVGFGWSYGKLCMVMVA